MLFLDLGDGGLFDRRLLSLSLLNISNLWFWSLDLLQGSLFRSDKVAGRLVHSGRVVSLTLLSELLVQLLQLLTLVSLIF